MTEDDYLRIAREVDTTQVFSGYGNFVLSESQMISIGSAIAAQVREECANECAQDVRHKYSATASILGYGNFFAALIRNKPCA